MTISEVRLSYRAAPLPGTIGNAKVFLDARETPLVQLVDAGSLPGRGETLARQRTLRSNPKSPLQQALRGAFPGLERQRTYLSGRRAC